MTADSSGNELDATLRGFAAGEKLFKRYTLTRTLGRGGMGIVWLAHDDVLDRDVALKFLPELVILDRAVLSDLKRETNRSLELTHKNIVRIYDFVHDDNSGCISMEYIDGDTLSNLRADRPTKTFETQDLTEWARQLCDALDYAHNHARVVHRDLKPANVMVNRRGDLKVADFGIARSLSDSVSMLTHGHGTSGTLAYMSPQQLDGDRGSHLDDIYSFGATIYELITSRPPFYSGNIDRQVHEKVPPPMKERRKELEITGEPIDGLWEKVVAACLHKDPARRPQSIAEVASRLNLGSSSTRTTATTSSAINLKSKKNALVIAGMAAGFLIIATAILLGLRHTKPAASSSPPSHVTPASTPGAQSRVWLGLQMQTIGAAETPRDIFPGVDKGVAVMAVDRNGPAAKSDVRRFDAITQIDGVPVGTYEDLRREIDKKKAGQKIELSVLRQGQSFKTSIDLGEMPKSETLVLNAREARERGDNNLAIDLLRKGAEQGDAQAQFLYGLLFYEGKVVAQDYTKSAEFFKKAADQGYSFALFYLALQHEAGTGVSQDYLKAAELLQRAIDQDNLQAEAALGWLYMFGKGVSQDYGKAVDLLQKASNQGNMSARANLAWCYQLGHGVPQDFSKAAELYQKSAEQGNSIAEMNLGRLYMSGKGVPQDFSKALDLLQKSASKGAAEANLDLAYLYAEGKGVSQNLSKAIELWQKAADNGNATAQNNLGVLYRDGKGVPQNYAKAFELFQKAAEKNYSDADLNLGALYSAGNGVPQNYERAAELYDKAANQGNAIAQGNLGNLYTQGRGVPLDYNKAAELLQKAANQGVANAQFGLGWLYDVGKGVPQNFKKAAELYQQAFDQGVVAAGGNLGFLYTQGKGVPLNYSRGAELLQKASDQNVAGAQVNLGWLYEKGNGVPQNYGKAAELYEKAAAQGNASAQSNLGTFYYTGKGVPQNRSKAIEFWQKAAAQGYEPAKKNLALVNSSSQPRRSKGR